MRNENRSISLSQAQRLIEFNSVDRQGRLLREELIAREAQLGKSIMTRRKRGKQTTFRVTIAAIRKLAPDLMPSKADELLKEARGYLSDIDRRIDDRVAEQISERVEPRFARMEQTQLKTSEIVRDTAIGVKRLTLEVFGNNSLPRLTAKSQS